MTFHMSRIWECRDGSSKQASMSMGLISSSSNVFRRGRSVRSIGSGVYGPDGSVGSGLYTGKLHMVRMVCIKKKLTRGVLRRFS